MATLKLTLDKRRKYNDGRSPLILRLTNKGKSTSIHLGTKLYENEWDDKKLRVLKNHPNSKDLNLYLKNQLFQYEKKLLHTESQNTSTNLIELKELLIGEEEVNNKLFVQFANKQIESLKKQNRFGTAQSFQTTLNQIVKFKGNQIQFSDIDYGFIKEFDLFLSKNKVSKNGVAVYMRAFRALLNIAINLKFYDISLYPFKQFKIRTEKTVSRAVSHDIIKLVTDVPLNNKEQEDARNIFILIFGLIGISFMDLVLLRKSNIQNGRIIYKRRKTGKLYSIKLLPQIEKIFELYKSESSDFLLPQFNLDEKDESLIRHQVNLGITSTNRYLKQIGKKLNLELELTTYVARYSWANIAKSQGYSKDLIAESLGHSYGNSVTGIYLEGYGNEVIDDANNKILNLVYKASHF